MIEKKMHVGVCMSMVAFILAIFGLLFVSCNKSSEEEWSKETNKIFENRSTQDLLNELYLASHGDEQSLARILQITPSSIERLRKGETCPTPKFDETLKQVTYYYYSHGRNYSKLRSFLDYKYSLSEKIHDFPSNHPWLLFSIAIIVVAIIIFGIICFFHDKDSRGCCSFGVILLLCGVVIFIYFCSGLSQFLRKSVPMEDKYIDVINPQVEQII